jgi:hypothetical protein
VAVVESSGKPEVLAFGPAPTNRRTRRAWFVAAVLLGVLAVGYAAWSLRPSPPRDLTLTDLEGVYTGMVRSDGLNELTTLTLDQYVGETTTVTPEECRPLVEPTIGNKPPSEALDGVSTYWLGDHTATISLFTLRFFDVPTASRVFDRIASGLPGCLDRDLVVGRDSGRLTGTAVEPGREGQPQVGYLLNRPSGGPYAFHILQYANTVTWQYRYQPRPGPYDPLAAQQLTDGLVSQLRAVQQAGS